MIATIFIVIYCLVLLAMYKSPKIKKLLYPQDSLRYFEDAVNEFDKNKKGLDDLENSDYKLGSGHIYK